MRWQRRWWDVDEVAGQASKLPISCFLPFPLHLFHSLSVLPWRLSGHWTWGCTELKSNVFQILKMHQPMPLLIFDFSLASPYNFFSHSFSTSSFFQYFFFHLDSFHSHLNGFAWNCPITRHQKCGKNAYFRPSHSDNGLDFVEPRILLYYIIIFSTLQIFCTSFFSSLVIDTISQKLRFTHKNDTHAKWSTKWLIWINSNAYLNGF